MHDTAALIMGPGTFLPPVLALVLAPLLLGIVNRTKAFFAGRRGAPLLQPYFDVLKLLSKGTVYSTSTTWLVKAGPVVGLATLIIAALLVPAGGLAAPVSFPGDFVLFAYLLALGRFFYIAAALDTASSFEGMGASREAQFSALSEPALFLALAALARQTSGTSLSSMVGLVSPYHWSVAFPALCLVVAAMAIVALCENSRIPVDDPNTHLELTMIHEVMVLDHGGPDLGLIQYSAALKLWLLGALLAGLALPVRSGNPWLDLGAFLGGMVLVAVAVGVIESTMARLQLLRVPKFLGSAAVMAALAILLVPRT